MRLGQVLLVVLLVTMSQSMASLRATTAQQPLGTNAKTVNVQLIVDASGSMGAQTNTGELRIASAKRVLTEVIDAIPDTEGVNVGLRVYGHLGDNTDAGRAESCGSSDLLVPMVGIDKPELLAEINTLQPVGWTPLGFALEQASSDFTQSASEDVVNAIVMVTDGLETCGGNPADVAGRLQSSDAGITTHLIGFGTTPDEQAVLSSVADAGQGQLLSSDNTGQLLSALFEVLEELEVVEDTGSGETRTSPLGIGRIGGVGDYEISVIDVTPNANDIVASENQFNEVPAPGNQYFMARVSATYIGDGSGNPAFELDYQTVGASSSSYTPFNNTCGVVPDDLSSVTEQFRGGSAEFNVCWEIESPDADSLVMYVESYLDFNGDPVWFSLGNPIDQPVETEDREADSPALTPTAAVGAEVDTGAGPVRSDSLESSRENPIPVGQTASVGDYQVTVLSVTPFADEMIATENQFNEAPAPGNQFFIASIETTYSGSTAGTPSFDLNYSAVGASSSSYTPFNNYCGVVPNDFTLATEQFPGGTTVFNMCWEVESADADSLVLYLTPVVDFDADPVWFSLQP